MVGPTKMSGRGGYYDRLWIGLAMTCPNVCHASCWKEEESESKPIYFDDLYSRINNLMVFYGSHNPNCLGSLGFNVCRKKLPAISQVLDCSHLDRRLPLDCELHRWLCCVFAGWCLGHRYWLLLSALTSWATPTAAMKCAAVTRRSRPTATWLNQKKASPVLRFQSAQRCPVNPDLLRHILDGCSCHSCEVWYELILSTADLWLFLWMMCIYI